MPLRAIFRETTKLLGFRDASDLLSGAFGLQLYTTGALKGLAVGAFVASLTAFCTRWIWNPPSALFLLIFLDLANGRYGFLVSKRMKGIGFKWSEFQRMGGIIISTLIIMGVVRNCINIYPHAEIMADVVFGWLFTTKAKKVVDKMVALKLQEEGLAKILKNSLQYFLGTKYGPLLVDSVQQPTTPAGPPAPEQPNPPLPGDTEQPS
jgi:hypothetical protein